MFFFNSKKVKIMVCKKKISKIEFFLLKLKIRILFKVYLWIFYKVISGVIIDFLVFGGGFCVKFGI